jgi:hypothetical protein
LKAEPTVRLPASREVVWRKLRREKFLEEAFIDDFTNIPRRWSQAWDDAGSTVKCPAQHAVEEEMRWTGGGELLLNGGLKKSGEEFACRVQT